MKTVSEIMVAADKLARDVANAGRPGPERQAIELQKMIEEFEMGPPAPGGLRPILTPWSLAPESIENHKGQPILLSTTKTPLSDMKIAAAAPEALQRLSEVEALLGDPRATEIDAKALLERITLLLDRVHGQ